MELCHKHNRLDTSMIDTSLMSVDILIETTINFDTNCFLIINQDQKKDKIMQINWKNIIQFYQ